MKRIAVLTSGGDAPGMNAAIRAVVRTASENHYETWGVLNGFQGLIEGNFRRLNDRDVGGILQRGGTILGSARSPEFKTDKGQKSALGHLEKMGLEGLIVIGGNGSQTGSYHLSLKDVPVLGISSTIDNDLLGTDITIGVDTAVNVALEAIDRLKVTASSHKRGIIVEVMGRNCGHLALMTGIAGGAEAILIPEKETSPEIVTQTIREAYKLGKKHALIVVAEGARCNANQLKEYFHTHHSELGYEMRTTVLGYTQRGGTPTLFDRMLATRFGHFAVQSFLNGEHGQLVGLISGQLQLTPLDEIVGRTKTPDLSLLEMAHTLAR